MTSTSIRRFVTLLLFLSAALVMGGVRPAYAGATIIVVNIDDPGEGFNDPTPAAPVGGNTGTTKGEQRLIAFRYAAELWGQTIDSPVTITVQAAFNPLGANILGSAGPIAVFRDFTGGGVGFFPGSEFPATWYGAALADKRAGEDLDPTLRDIRAQFSSDFNFYLGLDTNHGALNDLVTVVLHELGHGLNFLSLVNASSGANLAGFTDIYSRHLVDATTSLHWNEMNDAQRQASAIRFGKLVWDGEKVNQDIPSVLSLGSPGFQVTTPPAIARFYQFGTAAFGPPVGTPNVNNNIIAAVDAANAAGPATTDACTAITNNVSGKIVLIERGTCGFAVKARNASNAGASAIVIYNNAANAAAAAPGMADDGINGAFVTAPTISLNRADGLGIVAQLGGTVSARLEVDQTVRAGADELGRARLYAPNPVVSGSSVSHFDTVASRNLLMEPAINADLTHNLKPPYDLTLNLLRDVGWFPDADNDGVPDPTDCNPNSTLHETIVVDGVDTGVTDYIFANGCTITDLIDKVQDDAKNHGAFVSGVAHLTNDLVKGGFLTGADKGKVQSAAAHAN